MKRLLIAAAVLAAVPFLMLTSLATYSAAQDPVLVADIPPEYLALYQAAAERYGLDWAVLAGIGKVETDHGRLDAPGVTSGTNSAGAAGPMQFIAATWRAFRVDGDRDRHMDIYAPADAIYSAANHQRHHGAPDDYQRSLLAYNPADWYVRQVLAQAEVYRSAAVPAGQDVDAAGGAVRILARLVAVGRDVDPKVKVISDYRGAGDITSSGLPSDHAFNSADRAARDIGHADIADGLNGPPTPAMDKVVAAIGRSLGRHWVIGQPVIEPGFIWRGYRVQCYWRCGYPGGASCPEGHGGHLHIGLRREGT